MEVMSTAKEPFIATISPELKKAGKGDGNKSFNSLFCIRWSQCYVDTIPVLSPKQWVFINLLYNCYFDCLCDHENASGY